MARSLRAAVSSVDNDKDLNDFVSAYFPKVPAHPAEIKYERNPVSLWRGRTNQVVRLAF